MLFSKSTLVALLSAISLARADDSVTDSDISVITDFKQQNFGTTIGSSCACTILTGLFWGKVFFPGSSNYTYESKTHFYDLREDLAPKCVFVPKTANDIAKAVVVFEVCQSQFAVRGGGHHPVAGAANTDGGVLIGLSSFTTINVSSDQKSVEAGPGLNWYNMNSALEPYGLVVVGGRLKTIGIAGLTIGGGIHYFTARYGFAMDNVIAYDVVTASGKVVTATATSNSDLFWAMKGGGNNFGIVTKFTYAAYKVPTISTAIQIFGEDEVQAYISAVANLANYQDTVDTGAGGIFTIGYTPSTGAVSPQFLGVQAGSTVKPAVFDNFTAIPSEFSSYNVTTLAYWSSTLDTPYQVSRYVNEGTVTLSEANNDRRNVYGMHAVLADNATLQAMYTAYKAGTDAMKDIDGFSANLVFQPIPKSATTVAKTNGIGNTWGIDNTQAYVCKYPLNLRQSEAPLMYHQ